MSGGRASRTASDNEHVITFHAVKLQSGAHQGGVPERPKGTGCKPVGSAYGGSNPPAPITITHSLTSLQLRRWRCAVPPAVSRRRLVRVSSLRRARRSTICKLYQY